MDRRDVWLLLPRPLRELPADLAAVVILTIATLTAVFVPVINETPLRVVFGLCFVLFLPGYAFIAALFPEAGESPTSEPNEGPTDSSTPSVEKPSAVPGTDAAAAEKKKQRPQPRHTVEGHRRYRACGALIWALNCDRAVDWPRIELHSVGIRLIPIAVSVSLFTLISVAVAARRRHDLTPDGRFSVPYQTWIETGRSELFDPESRTDAALNVVLVMSILLAVGSVGYAVAVPPQGEQFSEFYLLTENPDGELVADGYPEELERGERAEMIVGIENNEYEPTNYTVVVQLQEVEQEGNETRVIDRQEVDRFSTTLEHNATHHERHVLEPTRTGEELRVQYLLYAGEAPETPTRENSYRDLHLWIDVVEER